MKHLGTGFRLLKATPKARPFEAMGNERREALGGAAGGLAFAADCEYIVRLFGLFSNTVQFALHALHHGIVTTFNRLKM